MTFFITDLETENKEYYGNKSSPHNPDNYIVAAGWCVDGGDIQSLYFQDKDDYMKQSSWFKENLQGQRFLVAHNATFEIHWFLKYHFDDFVEWLKQGGKVLCTQYMEFLISNQTELYPSLEDCATKYGGTKKIDEVKILWEQGVYTSEIDQALLMKYLADPEVGDIANTRRVCFNQIKILQDRGMWDMTLMRMDSLLFNAFATFFGLHVDLDIAKENQAKQEERITEIKALVDSYLPDDLPKELNFSYTSGYHMSAFLYGGTIKYQAKVSYDPPKYEQVEAYEYTNPSTGVKEYVLVPDEPHGISPHITTYKSGKNKGLPKVFKIDSTKEKLKWGDKEYTFKGLVDLKSLPELARDSFLGDQAEFVGARVLCCGTPVYSTSGDALDVLANHNVDIAKTLKELKALEKDTGTYYLRVDEKGKTTGMLQFVEPNNIVHHQLNNCATVTGRLSGSKPNFQNLPRDDEDDEGNRKSVVKAMFTSRFGSDGKIIEVDYTALEVVALASISGDKNLLEQLLAGTDMHCYRLAGALNESYEDVLRKCKDSSFVDNARYKRMRTEIKPKAFAAQYGASAHGIAYATGSTVEEAQAFLDTERKLFPESSTFAQRVVRPMVEETGWVGRKYTEDNNGVFCSYRRGYFQAKGGTCYSFRQFPKKVKGQTVYDYKDTQLANYWCQGEGSFIVQVACGRVIREFLARDFFNGKAYPINTVHDAIYCDAATEDLAKEVGVIVREIMASTPKWMCEVIPAYKDWNYHTTPFPAAAEYGSSMMEKIHIH